MEMLTGRHLGCGHHSFLGRLTVKLTGEAERSEC